MTSFLEDCSAADLRRFAICWLTSDKNCDWAKAASLYDPKVQVASFKTVTGRAAGKVTKGTELEGFSPSGGAGAAAGKKRKGAAAAAAEDGEEPAPKKKSGGRKKKAAAEESEEEQAAEEEIKGEEDGELE